MLWFVHNSDFGIFSVRMTVIKNGCLLRVFLFKLWRKQLQRFQGSFMCHKLATTILFLVGATLDQLDLLCDVSPTASSLLIRSPIFSVSVIVSCSLYEKLYWTHINHLNNVAHLKGHVDFIRLFHVTVTSAAPIRLAWLMTDTEELKILNQTDEITTC